MLTVTVFAGALVAFVFAVLVTVIRLSEYAREVLQLLRGEAGGPKKALDSLVGDVAAIRYQLRNLRRDVGKLAGAVPSEDGEGK